MRAAWSRSEFPEVVSWRFDRNRPFDRSWRKWSRSARVMEEKASTTSKYTRKTETNPNASPRKSCSSDLDNLIETLNLNSVQSDNVSFLAPLDRYQSEKPYHSRLPSGTSLARTNLVTSKHKLEIFDLS
ncbi:hypothetical protein BKA65DRAFT_500723 [Rhexocercosporidium sp. MPI-PUGE-AT-0058]|nr:hypothetical protein BKA65DRAFT_500723 [Rhexocercosporidium sp. MPI-PUGE-AT-0058]